MSRKYFCRYTVELVKEDECKYKGKIATQKDAYDKFVEVFKLDKKAEEHFVLFCLDCKNQIIGAFLISKGGINFSNVNICDIIKRALLCNSTKIILAHNHPSGKLDESSADIITTKKIIEACNTMNIELLDHLIITDESFKSLREKVILN